MVTHLKRLENVLKQCKPEDTSDSVEDFAYSAETSGIGCYLNISQDQRIPIVAKSFSDLEEKIMQITPDYKLLLDGKVLNANNSHLLYKYANIKVYSHSIKPAKVNAQTESHLNSGISQLKYNTSFIKEMQAIVVKYVEGDDVKIIMNHIKNMLDKL
eukprot:NODE_331_length_10750_cov_0.204676.p6 type:complete len:157 gc:universal NODE_331_length_10750_cov_0.204676:6101-5631(-)